MEDAKQMAGRLEQDGYLVLRNEFPQHLLEALREDAHRYSFRPPHSRGGGSFAMGSLAYNESGPRLAAAFRGESPVYDSMNGGGLVAEASHPYHHA